MDLRGVWVRMWRRSRTGGGRFLALLALGSLLAACSDSTGPSEPEPEPEGSWLMVDVGSCGLTLDREAFCWGIDVNGELGQGIAKGQFDPPPLSVLSPSPVVGGLKFEWIDAGKFHTCALTPAGEAFCWGWAREGRLGDGTTTGGAPGTPIPVIGELTFRRIHTGSDHTCALTSAGEAYCWGFNEQGQLGDGTTDGRLSPVPVSGGLTFRQITTGGGHTCGLRFGGQAFCWGRNDTGQLGKGTFDDGIMANPLPTPVDTELTFRQISAGNNTTCAVTFEGEAFCWGDNRQAQIGDRSSLNRSSPTPVSPGVLPPPHGLTELRFKQISVGRTVCALTAEGEVFAEGEAFCWGENGSGQFGDGTTRDLGQPTPVSGGLTFRQISTGSTTVTCGVTVDDELFCWGAGVGDGTFETRLVPTKIVPPEE